MNNSENITDFIIKLNSGKLKKSDIDQFEPAFRTEIPDEDLDSIYRKTWKQTADAKEMPGSDAVLDRIYHRLKLKKDYKARWLIIPEWYKYVAILLIAFTGGWLGSRVTHQVPNSLVESEPFMNEISVEYGSKSRITLPDGTTVKLNSGSRLMYPSHFETNMRKVHLEGEGFFDVSKDENRPFFVNTQLISIKVLGTSFNVKSYAEENLIETTLVEGSVEIYNELANESPFISKAPIATLKPSDKATFIKNINTISVNQEIVESGNRPTASTNTKAGIMIENAIETTLFTAWKDNVLRFKGERFEDIAIKLERWYDVKIDLQNNSLKEEHFTGQFDTETIEQALEALKLTAKFRYTINKNEIKIY